MMPTGGRSSGKGRRDAERGGRETTTSSLDMVSSPRTKGYGATAFCLGQLTPGSSLPPLRVFVVAALLTQRLTSGGPWNRAASDGATERRAAGNGGGPGGGGQEGTLGPPQRRRGRAMCESLTLGRWLRTIVAITSHKTPLAAGKPSTAPFVVQVQGRLRLSGAPDAWITFTPWLTLASADTPTLHKPIRFPRKKRSRGSLRVRPAGRPPRPTTSDDLWTLSPTRRAPAMNCPRLLRIAAPRLPGAGSLLPAAAAVAPAATAAARAPMATPTTTPRRARRGVHTIPEAKLQYATNELPGFLSPAGFKIAWTDYQKLLVTRLNTMISGGWTYRGPPTAATPLTPSQAPSSSKTRQEPSSPKPRATPPRRTSSTTRPWCSTTTFSSRASRATPRP
jgi:hypothetical protein